MNNLRLILAITIMSFVTLIADGQIRQLTVADSLTRTPLSNASVFNNKGIFIGTSRKNGKITCATFSDFPITVRYMGYHERTIAHYSPDSILLVETMTELPEIVVDARQKKMLHILAYVREYSSLSSYTDTITMFREKMVDFMLPTEKKTRFKGWRYPRTLNSRSYYRFTNVSGLDSVSDRCNHHFTWSDWIGMIPPAHIPDNILKTGINVDTTYGKYSPAEIWTRTGDRLSIDIDVLADTANRKWVPNISYFFRKEDTDFERFGLKLNYEYFSDNEINPLGLTGYSFTIESRGRGRGMFLFNRHDQPFFVTTYAEVYILDKEFIPVKEAREWDDFKFYNNAVDILEPQEAPELSLSTLTLIDRVNNIYADRVRLTIKPDERLVGRNVSKQNFSIGHRALGLLKQLTGITFYKSHKNVNDSWNEFRDKQKKQNLKRRSE